MNTGSFLIVDKLGVSLGDRSVLDKVSFALPNHGVAALVGPNGAGKTTLLRAMAGLVPFTGTVRLGDHDIAALSIRERAKRLAYLPQGHVVHWPLPVRDIVALGRFPHGATDPTRLGPHDFDAVETAMHATDVVTLADRPVTELSGGERSRVALARVLAVAAPVVLADEPIASLDPRYQIETMSLLRRTADSGTLVIVVTHDLGLAARFADTVLLLREGRLVASGPPRDALAPDILADVFRVDAYRGEHAGKLVIVPWSTI